MLFLLMASPMHSLLKSRKAQFFVLTAFSIVTLFFLISNWVQPFSIIDTSAVVLSEEPFIFNNIKENARRTVETGKSCEELEFNLEEYENFVKTFGLRKNLDISLIHSAPSSDCELTGRTTINIKIKLSSSSMILSSDFNVEWQKPA